MSVASVRFLIDYSLVTGFLWAKFLHFDLVEATFNARCRRFHRTVLLSCKNLPCLSATRHVPNVAEKRLLYATSGDTAGAKSERTLSVKSATRGVKCLLGQRKSSFIILAR